MSNKYRYRLTFLAEQDIDSALNYIANQLCNGQAANDLFDQLENSIENICTFPYSSADCTCFLITDQNIRHLFVENFALIYEIKEQEKEIIILRFRYKGTDFTSLKI